MSLQVGSKVIPSFLNNSIYISLNLLHNCFSFDDERCLLQVRKMAWFIFFSFKMLDTQTIIFFFGYVVTTMPIKWYIAASEVYNWEFDVSERASI